jgi:sortase A
MRGKAAQTLEIALLLIGIAALTVYGLLEFDQMRGQADLRAQFENAETSLPTELPGDAPQEALEDNTPALSEKALGRLTSERIGLDVMIAEGVDHKTLRRAAGRIPGTARLDSEGNVGIAAHRDTFFRPLRKIETGDVLEIETYQRRYRYRVEWTAVVDPHDVQFLKPSSASELTLVTCFPFYYVGPAPRRFIVRATRVDDGATKAAAGNKADS